MGEQHDLQLVQEFYAAFGRGDIARTFYNNPNGWGSMSPPSQPVLTSFEAAARTADTTARRVRERFPPMPLSTMAKAPENREAMDSSVWPGGTCSSF